MTRRIAVVVAILVLTIVVCGCELLQNLIPTLPPEAVISIEKTRLQPNESVPVSARGSTSPSGNALTEFIWNFGDGSSDVVLSHPHAPRYSYPYGGNYTITLVVKDDWGRYSNPDTILVTVNHHPVPVAYPQKLTSWPIGQAFYRIPDGQVVYPRSRIEPQGIIPVMSYTYWKIDSSSSSDRDGWIISQHLNWAGNHIGSGQVFYIAIPADGSMYTIELTVIDNEGLGNSMRYGLVSPLG